MCLCDLRLGEKAKINVIKGNDKLTKRLYALGDPLVVNLRGFDLAIRKKDAKNIILTA